MYVCRMQLCTAKHAHNVYIYTYVRPYAYTKNILFHGAKKHRGKLGSSGLFAAGFAPPIAATSCGPAASKQQKGTVVMSKHTDIPIPIYMIAYILQ